MIAIYLYLYLFVSCVRLFETNFISNLDDDAGIFPNPVVIISGNL